MVGAEGEGGRAAGNIWWQRHNLLSVLGLNSLVQMDRELAVQPWSCGARASAARGVQQLPCVSEVDAERRGLEPGAGGKPWRGHSVREGPGYRARGNRGNRGWGALPGDGCRATVAR